MGNPINSIVWLANKLAEFDDYLRAGEIIISGSIVTPIRVRSGDHIKATFTRLGAVGAKFV
jgi:2-keto-4-pentenoate hydratase